MKKCKDIQELLSLYLDDSLSAADKKIVAEHLKSCPHCTKEISRLSKAATLVNSIREVNPPPWFKQKIMARVREEAQKESFIQKWFYPLKIKIPVQVFATICIAVLAVYIYRAGEEQTKEVVPSYAPAPIVEVQKSPLSEQREKTLPDQELKAQDKIIKKNEISRAITAEKSVDLAKDSNEQMSADKKANQYDSAPVAKSAAAPEAMEMQKDIGVMGAAMKGKRAPQAQSLSPKASTEMRKDTSVTGAAMKRDSTPQPPSLSSGSHVLLKVSDVDAAAGELEKILIKYGARNITRRINQGKTTFIAELGYQKLNDFLVQLKMIGQVESKDIAADSLKDKTIVMIDIVNR